MPKTEAGFLPDGLVLDSLLWLVAPELWKNDPEKALILALRRSGRLDCARYLKEYPDVAAAGMDPDVHFVRHGRLEGRTIRLMEPETAPAPLEPAMETNEDRNREMDNLKKELEQLRAENHLLMLRLEKLLNEDDR